MEETGSSQAPAKKKGNLLLKLIPYLIVLIIGVVGGTYLVKQKPTWFGLPRGTTTMTPAEINALVAKVSKLMILPTDESPTVATVDDSSAVKDQPFFAQAKNGDIVLVYQNAGEAILYRESENKIIKVGAVNFNQATPSPAPVTSPAASPKSSIAPAPVASPAQ